MGPLVIDTHDLVRQPGAMIEVKKSVPAPPDLGVAGVIAVPEGDPLELDLRLEAALEGVLATGTVNTLAKGECSRCLDPVELPVSAPIQELFLFPERHHAALAAGDPEASAADLALLVGDLADIEPAVRDSIVTGLPFRPLCHPDCPGLCPQCGARLADDPGHHHEVIDPRWAALRNYPALAKES